MIPACATVFHPINVVLGMGGFQAAVAFLVWIPRHMRHAVHLLVGTVVRYLLGVREHITPVFENRAR